MPQCELMHLPQAWPLLNAQDVLSRSVGGAARQRWRAVGLDLARRHRNPTDSDVWALVRVPISPKNYFPSDTYSTVWHTSSTSVP